MREGGNAMGKAFKEYGIVAALVAITAIFALLSGGTLLAPNNIASLIQQNAYVMVLTIGMTMVIVARHIDLSVGSTVAFVGGIVGLAMYDFHLSWPLAVLIGLAVGALAGCWQGFWVAYAKVPAFIVTLGGMLIFRGLAIVIVERTVSGLPRGFVAISNGSLPPVLGYVGQLDMVTVVIGLFAILAYIFTALRSRSRRAKSGLALEPMVPMVAKVIVIAAGIGYFGYLLALSAGGTPIVLMVIGVLVVVYSFVMNHTPFGRHVYAVGGNLKSAKLSGVNTRRVDFLVFVNMGVLAAVAGVITTSRAGAAVATAGNLYELDAIAAAFIGGTAVSGGVGKISGSIIGALVMGVLNMGLSILSVDSAWQQSIKGLVVILAVAINLMNRRKSAA